MHQAPHLFPAPGHGRRVRTHKRCLEDLKRETARRIDEIVTGGRTEFWTGDSIVRIEQVTAVAAVRHRCGVVRTDVALRLSAHKPQTLEDLIRMHPVAGRVRIPDRTMKRIVRDIKGAIRAHNEALRQEAEAAGVPTPESLLLHWE